MDWKERLVQAYTTVPKTAKEGVWKISIALTAIMSGFVGFSIWKNPEIVMGIPLSRRSVVERFVNHEYIKDAVYDLMDDFYVPIRPYGMMFVAWESVDSMVGLWVKPADKFPGKNGPHDLSPDMRVLGGPFLFGECARTPSLAMPDKIMVACPFINDYDVWGYVAAIVDSDAETIAQTERLLEVLAHRITELIY